MQLHVPPADNTRQGLKRQLQNCAWKFSSVHIAVYVKHMQQTRSDLHTLQNGETLRNGLQHWGYVPFNRHLKFRVFPHCSVSPTRTFMRTIAHSESIAFKYSHIRTRTRTHACTQTSSQSAYLWRVFWILKTDLRLALMPLFLLITPIMNINCFLPLFSSSSCVSCPHFPSPSYF